MQPYKHSGRFTPIGLVLALAAALIAAAPLGWLYTWLMMVTTYQKLRALETIIFGALVGVAAGYGCVAGKVRNNAVAAGIGALGGIVGHYVGWAVFIQRMFALENKVISAVDLATHPAAMWHIAVIFNQYGTWTEENSSPTTGVMLWIIWAVEALTVIAMATFVAYAISDNRPFCETCGRWADSEPAQFFQMTVGKEQFKALLLSGDFATLAKIPRATAKFAHYKVEQHRCLSCNNLNTVSVAIGGTRQGGSVLAKSVLPPDQADRLRALAAGAAAAGR